VSAPWVKVSDSLPRFKRPEWKNGPSETDEVLVAMRDGFFKIAICVRWPESPALWKETQEHMDITKSVTHWQYITTPEKL